MVVHFTVSDVKFVVTAMFLNKGFVVNIVLVLHFMLGFGKYDQS